MKTPFRHTLTAALAFLLLTVCAHAVPSVSLSVSPTSITNDYRGQITLTISGLTNGQSIRIKRFYDFDADGLISAETDLLIRSFEVTDGQLPLIAGVRNLNVPGDEDGLANGEITAALNHPGLDPIFGGVSGRFVFAATDPQSGAVLATQLFTVAQKELAQGVRGRITRPDGSGLSSGLIALVAPDGPGGTLTAPDTNGNYTIYAQPGSYMIIPVFKGYIADNSAGFVSIAPGQFETNDQQVLQGDYTLSGTITDETSGKGIAGVFVHAQGQDFFAGAFSDDTGAYTVPVNSNLWEIELQREALAELGYLAPDDAVGLQITGTTNLDLTVSKASALIYGTITDSSGHPLSGIEIEASDSSGQFSGFSLSTGTNGSFALSVMPGTWWVGLNGDDLAARGYLSAPWTNLTIAADQAIQADFVVPSVTAHLRGQALDSQGNPVANAMLLANLWPWSGGQGSDVFTDQTGHFDIGLHAGTWNLQLEAYGAQELGYVNKSYLFEVADGSDQDDIQITFPLATRTISGTVKDSSNNPVAGIQIMANQNTNFFSAAETDDQGRFSLGVLGGSWNVNLSSEDLSMLGYATPNPQNITIGGSNALVNFVLEQGAAVSLFVVNKQRNFLQTSADFVQSASFQAGCGLSQSYPGAVISANITLPTGTNVTLAPTPGLIQIQHSDTFSGQSAMDSAYPSGAYVFSFSTAHTGTRTATLMMDSSLPAYPDAPQISNFAELQTVYPASGFSVQWNGFPAGTSNDLITLQISDNGQVIFNSSSTFGNPIMDGTSTSCFVPQNVLQTNHSYQGSLTFSKVVARNTGDYPGALGIVSASSSTMFNLATTSGVPFLSITSTNLPDGTQGLPYQFTLTTEGSSLPLHWWFEAGYLPSGLTLNHNSGQISGIPGESGVFPITVRVSDNRLTAILNMTLSIRAGTFPRPSLSITRNGNLHLGFETVPGQIYTVESSSDLLHWRACGSLDSFTNFIQLPALPLGQDRTRFFRARIGREFTGEFNFMFFVDGGSFASSLIPVANYPKTLETYSAVFHGNYDPTSPLPSDVSFSGPTLSGVNQMPAASAVTNHFATGVEGVVYQTPTMLAALSKLPGLWNVNYEGTNLSFDVPTQQENLVIPLPAVTLSNGNLLSVDWSYHDPITGASLPQAPAWLRKIHLQVDGTVGNRIYHSPDLQPDTSTHNFPFSIAWSNVSAISMTYSDLAGNQYVITFHRP